ncbi:MAG: YfhO family protein [Candidatus Latescibacterota bacterium]
MGHSTKKMGMIEKRSVRQKRFFVLNSNRQHLLYMLLLLTVIAIVLFRVVFLRLTFVAPDTMAWRGAAQCMIAYRQQTGHVALWNGNTFSGMPGYMISVGNLVPSMDSLLGYLSVVLGWPMVYLALGALFLYLLLIRKGAAKYAALAGALAFALMPHFFSLFEAGHNTKLRSIMYIPLIFMAMDHMFDRRNLWSFLLASLALSLQLRANHPQIIYYTWLMLALYLMAEMIRHGLRRNFWAAAKTALLFAGVLVFSLALVAQPYWANYEYSEFTMRGGDSGLSTEYATSWSFHPLEMLTFLVPSFFGLGGGTYWGWMPFTSTSMYMGLVPLLFAILALIYRHRDSMVRFLGVLSVTVLLISFGKHIPVVSNLLLNYLPYFNKFRVPSMILCILQFSVAILAAYGLDFVLNQDRDWAKLRRVLRRISLVLGGLLLLGLLAKGPIFSLLSGFMFEKMGETAKVAPDSLLQLKHIRFDMLARDFAKLAILFCLMSVLIVRYLRKKIRKSYVIILLIGMLVGDLWLVDRAHLRNLQNPELIEKVQFGKTSTDAFLLEDTSDFRVFPVGQLFGDNRWSYYHQSIGGYHAAKLRIYQDVLEHCLYSGAGRFPINMNIVNMLNAKYLIAQGRLPEEGFELVHYDKASGQLVYLNKNVLPRAFLVTQYEVISDRQERLNRLNAGDFNPSDTALLEKSIEVALGGEKGTVEMARYALHEISMATNVATPSLLVLSEIYYPAGWKAYVDGKETEIFKTDHILRSVLVPKGKHQVEFVFAPQTYNLGIWVTSIASILLFGGLGIEGFRRRHRFPGILRGFREGR